MADITTYHAWEYPIEYSSPWYNELLAMFQSIDENTAKHRSGEPVAGTVQLETTDSGKAYLLRTNTPSVIDDIVVLPVTVEIGSRFYFFSTGDYGAISSGGAYIESFSVAGTDAVADYNTVISYGRGCYLELVGHINGNDPKWFVAGGRGVWVFINTDTMAFKTISFDVPIVDIANHVWCTPDVGVGSPFGYNTINDGSNHGIVNGTGNSIVVASDGAVVVGYDNQVGALSRANHMGFTQGRYAFNHWNGSKTFSPGRSTSFTYESGARGINQCGIVPVFATTTGAMSAVLATDGNDTGESNPLRLDVRSYSSVFCNMMLIARKINSETDYVKSWNVSWTATRAVGNATIITNSLNKTVTASTEQVETEDWDVDVSIWVSAPDSIKITVTGSSGSVFWSGKIDFTEVCYAPPPLV